MLIQRVTVSGLFDRFDHDLVFSSDERITIVIGPNGFGKTTILRILDSLFNRPVRALGRMPFRRVTIYFDDSSTLTVSRTTGDATSFAELKLAYTSSSGNELQYTPQASFDPNELAISINAIEDVVPNLAQIGPREWRDVSTDAILDLDSVLEQYGLELPWDDQVPELAKPEWLSEIRNNIAVRLIDTERLTQPPSHSARRVATRWHRERPQRIRTVRRYSEELGQRVQMTLSDYGSRAQSLDRTFPVRLVEEPAQTDVTMEQLRQELAEVEARRTALVDAGLLVQEREGPVVPPLEQVDESRRGVLAVYARDAREKLSIFDDLYMRIEALKRISNDRLLYKKVSVGPDGLTVTSSDGSPLDLEALSSGEQHQLVNLYELLFRVTSNSLILFDEPELSLHVEWQFALLEDLEVMANISKFQVLLATHSPQIIGDRWDLTVELKGSELA